MINLPTRITNLTKNEISYVAGGGEGDFLPGLVKSVGNFVFDKKINWQKVGLLGGIVLTTGAVVTVGTVIVVKEINKKK